MYGAAVIGTLVIIGMARSIIARQRRGPGRHGRLISGATGCRDTAGVNSTSGIALDIDLAADGGGASYGQGRPVIVVRARQARPAIVARAELPDMRRDQRYRRPKAGPVMAIAAARITSDRPARHRLLPNCRFEVQHIATVAAPQLRLPRAGNMAKARLNRPLANDDEEATRHLGYLTRSAPAPDPRSDLPCPRCRSTAAPRRGRRPT